MLKSVAPGRGTPRVAASGLAARLMTSGLINQHDLSVACIMKPFNPDVLLSRVTAVFRRLKVVTA